MINKERTKNLQILVSILIIFAPITCDYILFSINYKIQMQFIYIAFVISSIIGLTYIYKSLDE